MKIGVLTFHNIPNVGAVLQAYALCHAFRREGCDCDIIDYTCKNIERRELQSPKTGNWLKDIAIKYLIWPTSRRKIKACQQFMKEVNMYSQLKYCKDTIRTANSNYDVFVSGSDMIWNLDVTAHDWTYFCDFVDERKKKYAYGSSIGGRWEANDLRQVEDLLHRYSMIGVRESDTCIFLNEIGVKSALVADPTMLLSAEEWKSKSVCPKEKKYVLVYFPSEKNMESAKSYAIREGLSVVVLNWGLPLKGAINASPLSPKEWIGYFFHATAVFTGSFHGLLFSLYFHKPVWTDNNSNRVQSILNKLSIKECNLQLDPDLTNRIDYKMVSKRISDFREDSLRFLKQIINDFAR